MSLKEIVKLSLRSIWKNKLRTVLTVLGMTVGVASIIIVFSAGEGIRSLIINQIESFGTNIIRTELKVPSDRKGMSGESQNAMSLASGVQITSLKEKDLIDINKLENIKDGYGTFTGQETVTYANESRQATIFGVSPSYINIDNSKVAEGYFFTDNENNSLAQVVVLGPKIAQQLFGDEDPVGKNIVLKKRRFRVIGVLASKGATVGLDFDSLVLMPIKTMQKKIVGVDYYIYIIHQVVDPAKSEETAAAMIDILRENHNTDSYEEDDFRIMTMKEMMDISETVTSVLTILLLLIVLISLVVGGIGILNVMYVIVSERTPEIGLRKAVGAKFSDIMLQFLIESVLITLLGGILGILFGFILSFFIYLGANYFGLSWKFKLPWESFLTAILFALFFGVLFGLLPARKAGQLDPVEALRKD